MNVQKEAAQLVVDGLMGSVDRLERKLETLTELVTMLVKAQPERGGSPPPRHPEPDEAGVKNADRDEDDADADDAEIDGADVDDTSGGLDAVRDDDDEQWYT